MSKEDAKNTLLKLDTKLFTENVITLPGSTPLRDVFRAVSMSPSAVVLISEDSEINKLCGMITADDVVKTQDADKATVSSLIKEHGQQTAVFDNAELWQVLKIMNGENVSKKKLDVVPVVDKEKRIRGVISRKNLEERLSSLDALVNAARYKAPSYD